MDYSTFRRYYIDKIYRIIDHFAKFMNSSWKNFKNINIAFLIIFFSNFPSFRRMANLDYGLWKKEKKKKRIHYTYFHSDSKLLSKDRKLEFTLPSRIIIANLKLKLANSLDKSPRIPVRTIKCSIT